MYEHKNGLAEGFTKKYKVYTLVYYEETNDIHAALQREKQLKKWNRKWKLALIERVNPDWDDIAKNWIPDKCPSGMTKWAMSFGHDKSGATGCFAKSLRLQEFYSYFTN